MPMLPPQTEEQKRKSESLRELIAKAQVKFDALSYEEQQAHREAQRRSWVVGETMLENPDMTREEAEALYESAILHR